MRPVLFALLHLWQLAAHHYAVARPSVHLFANEENLASLYYMRARIRMGLGWQ